MKSLQGDFYTSKLGRVETIRAIKKFYPSWLKDSLQLLDSISLLAISDEVLNEVEKFGQEITLKASDAIHIATALLILDEEDYLVTLDRQMLINAEILGLRVISA